MVVDQYFEGALMGFWQGWEAIAKLNPQPITQSNTWLLLLACDLPNLRGDILATWAQDLANLPPQAIAYLPRHFSQDPSQDHRKSWEPLCGFYRWQCRDSLANFIKSGGRSFQKWLSDRQDPDQVIAITPVPPAMLLNCNTPQDFIALSA